MTSPVSEPRTDLDYHEALRQAEAWSEGGYSQESRAYWTGMRDTLRVVLGITTVCPSSTGPGTDTAAVVLLHGKGAK